MNEMSFEPYSVQLSFQMPSPLSNKQWRTILADYMESLARLCCEEGTCVIGHIKGLAEFSENGFLKISVTNLDHPAEVDGQAPDNLSELSFSLTALIYGPTREKIAESVGKTIALPDSPWCGRVNINPDTPLHRHDEV